jgi:hypothetical protein
MKLYKTKVWKDLFGKQPRHKKYDGKKDIGAIIEFLQDLNNDVNLLLPDFKKLQELEKEREVATSGVVQVNINTQSKLFDSILERYEFFHGDVSINGLRLQNLAEQLLNHATSLGMKDLVQQKKQDRRWKFRW